MKVIAFILLFLSAVSGTSQNPGEEQLLIAGLLENKVMRYSKPVIVSKLDTALVAYQLATLLNNEHNTFQLTLTGEERSISLTEQEKQKLVDGLRAQYRQRWERDDFQDHSLIDNEHMMPYLRDNYYNTVAIVSKPVFIRDGTIAMVFLANFCCGGTGGFAELSLYKKQQGSWERWIPLSQGDF